MKNILSFLQILLCSLYFIQANSQSIWEMANENKDILRISTLFTAQNVRNYLSEEEGVDKAIEWCKNMGITRVFLETFRGGYTAERETLLKAKDMFLKAGIEVAGCVTTTGAGKISSQGGQLCCFTNVETHKELKRIFEYTASLFDTIMIDDFLMTDCQCDECQAARGNRPMGDYRCDLMNRVSRDYILKPAKAVNPKAVVIIKYPLWYDFFHMRGYDVVGETNSYDMIWVGTETRDYDYYINDDSGEIQYHAYYVMRWLGEIGGSKTGGGWFDHIHTSPDTYVEQARQTVLAGAKEMMLFNYSSCIQEIDNIGKLHREIPLLFELAKMVKDKPLKGISAPKPPDSDAYPNFNAREPFFLNRPDVYIYDFIGMMGLPLVPSARIDAQADAAFFPFQVMKDPGFMETFNAMMKDNKPVLVTDSLAKHLGNIGRYKNCMVLPVNGNTHTIMKISGEKLNGIRNKLLEPLGIKMDAPNKVGLYLMGDDLMIIENFNITPVTVNINTTFPMDASVKLILPGERNVRPEFSTNSITINRLPQRTLVAIKY